jgi:hypothetical protein
VITIIIIIIIVITIIITTTIIIIVVVLDKMMGVRSMVGCLWVRAYRPRP